MTTYYDAEASSAFLDISLPKDYLQLYAECYDHSVVGGIEWNDDMIAQQREIMHAVYNTDKGRATQSIRAKNGWRMPGHRENKSMIATLQMLDPNMRSNAVNTLNEERNKLWNDPEHVEFMSKTMKSKRWYNNGVVAIRCEGEPPEGFKPGRLRR